MIHKVTSLDEDFKALGLEKPNLLEQIETNLGLKKPSSGDSDEEILEEADAYKCESCGEIVHKPKGKSKDDDDEDDDDMEEASTDQQYPPPKCPKCGKAGLKPYVVPSGKKEDNDADDNDSDPLESSVVNTEMFTAIRELPFKLMSVEGIDEVIDTLKERELPEDASDELKEEAKAIVDLLFAKRDEISEGPIAGRSKRRKGGKAGKGSIKKRASGGFHMKDGKAVKQKPGEMKRKARKKKLYAKSGSGKKSARKSTRMSKRFDSLEINTPALGEEASPFARELHALVEDKQVNEVTVRQEIIERVCNVFEMLDEEFRDEDVSKIFEDAFTNVMSAWDAGRLDEDVMDEDEFIGEIRPILTLIQKSLDRIDRAERGGLGNE